MQFRPIPGKVKVYEETFVATLNNDARYLYQICHAVQNGIISDELSIKLIGHVHSARWLTCASNTLRHFVQEIDESVWLRKICGYIVNVYAPSYFRIKHSPNITNGFKHLYQMIMDAKSCFRNDEETWEIFLVRIMNNSFFLNQE